MNDAALDRLVSTEAIRQLVSRYALAVDSRDLDSLVALFVDDVKATRTEVGRPALRAEFDSTLRRFRRSIHFVMNHVIEFSSEDRAEGTVYCRAEHEDGASWVVMALAYTDEYERVAGQWFFRRRKARPWYALDSLERPPGAPTGQWAKSPPVTLPDAWSTWGSFWSTA